MQHVAFEVAAAVNRDYDPDQETVTEHVRIPVFGDDAVLAATFTRGGGHTDVIAREGKFYTRVNNVPNPTAAQTVGNLFAQRILTQHDVAGMETRFAIHQDQLLKEIAEPAWLVEVRDSGNRMNHRENARQEVSVSLTIDRDASFSRPDAPTKLTRGGVPTVTFSCLRREAADRMTGPLTESVPWAVPGRRDVTTFRILRPDLFVMDDLSASLRMAGPMLVGIGFNAMTSLPRVAIERLLSLRSHIAAVEAGTFSRISAGQLHRDISEFLASLRTVNEPDAEARNWIKRGAICAALLEHRVGAETGPVPERAPGHQALHDLEELDFAP